MQTCVHVVHVVHIECLRPRGDEISCRVITGVCFLRTSFSLFNITLVFLFKGAIGGINNKDGSDEKGEEL